MNNEHIEVIKPQINGLFCNYIFKAIPLAFDESLSYYECLCGLLKYLKDTIIPTINNNGDAIIELQNNVDNFETNVINLYNQLKEYVDNYFNNLDVQEEINNKLDEMVEDGILESIIGNIFNNKVSKIIPFSLLNGNYYINVTYNNLDTTQKYLNYSKNGYEWVKVCDIPKDAFIHENAFDIHTKIINNEFVMIYDVLDKDFNGWRDLTYWAGGNRIAISKTKDFITWEKYYLDIDLQYKQTFSPCFFIANNKVYFTVSMSDTSELYQETLSGNYSYKKYTYLCELNEELDTIVNTELILESTLCTIDSQIYEDNNYYYLFVKNENDDTIMEFKSDTFHSFSNKINELKYHLITTTGYTQMEGPAITKIGNLYYLYADLHGILKTCVYISDNIETWYNHNLVYSDDRMVNFGVEEITTNDKRDIMKNLFEVYNYPENRKPFKSTYNKNNDNEYLTYESTETTFNKFYVLPDKKYTGLVNSYNITLDLSLINTGEMFSFISKQGSNKSITISNTNIHGEANDVVLNYCDTKTFIKYVTSNICTILNDYSTIKKISGRYRFTNVTANTYASADITAPNINWENTSAVLLTPVHGTLDTTREIYCCVSAINNGSVTIAIKPSIDIINQDVYYEIIYNPIS